VRILARSKDVSVYRAAKDAYISIAARICKAPKLRFIVLNRLMQDKIIIAVLYINLVINPSFIVPGIITLRI